MKNHRAILVGTSTRGLFFGWVPKDGPDNLAIFGGRVELKSPRIVIYWNRESGGVHGLAVTGPMDGCRIGPAAESAVVGEVTGITDVSDAALAAWEGFRW